MTTTTELFIKHDLTGEVVGPFPNREAIGRFYVDHDEWRTWGYLMKSKPVGDVTAPEAVR